MRKFALLGLMMLLLAPVAAFAEKGELPEGQMKAAIAVSGMTCGGCCTKVETAVAKMEGVVDVKADYEKGIATVVYEKDTVNVKQIVEVINTKTSFKAEAPEEKTS